MNKSARRQELIEEIQQIREQYQAEVGSRRKPWPRSIRERVFELRQIGMPLPALAKKINIPYQTITSWQSKQKAPEFHALTVSAPTVTVGVEQAPALVTAAASAPEPTVTVRTPNGFLIEIPASRAGGVLRDWLGEIKCF